jgi:1-acyl-sn-glycerol-3-phosphate acyltransferase
LPAVHRLPLADELPYRFLPPRPSAFWFRATRGFRNRMLRREHEITRIELRGGTELGARHAAGDAVLLAPNHPGRADGLVLLDVAGRMFGRPTCAMAAYQIFRGSAGLRNWLFPRLGIFPVDREGADLAAFKAAVQVLAGDAGGRLLTVFPEGEVYHLADRLTPLREGVASIALAAQKRLSESGRTLWLVPVGLKYRFEEGHDPLPLLLAKLDAIEAQLTWRPRRGRPVVERLYHFAQAMAALKELEYLGQSRDGPLPGRLEQLAAGVLEPLERAHLGRTQPDGGVPPRVKTLRAACLKRLADAGVVESQRNELRHQLDDLHFVMQAFSYRGDYVAQCPTVERLAESITKLDEDLLLRGGYARPYGPRRAQVEVGEAIDVRAFAGAGRARQAATALTGELERRLQAALDAIGPGRALPPECC